MTKYRKTLVAAAGAAVAIIARHFCVESDLYFDAVVVLTALGVYGVANSDA